MKQRLFSQWWIGVTRIVILGSLTALTTIATTNQPSYAQNCPTAVNVNSSKRYYRVATPTLNVRSYHCVSNSQVVKRLKRDETFWGVKGEESDWIQIENGNWISTKTLRDNHSNVIIPTVEDITKTIPLPSPVPSPVISPTSTTAILPAQEGHSGIIIGSSIVLAFISIGGIFFMSHQNHKNNMMTTMTIMKMVGNLRDDHNKMIAKLEQRHKNIFIPILVTRNTSFLFFESYTVEQGYIEQLYVDGLPSYKLDPVIIKSYSINKIDSTKVEKLLIETTNLVKEIAKLKHPSAHIEVAKLLDSGK